MVECFINLIFALFFLLLFVGLSFVVYSFVVDGVIRAEILCQKRAEIILNDKTAYKYDNQLGCFLQIDGKYIPYDKYNYTESKVDLKNE